MGLLNQLRSANINSELYPESAKLKKQMSYADKKGISYCLMAGSREIESGEFTLKNMVTGEQENLTIEQVIERINCITSR